MTDTPQHSPPSHINDNLQGMDQSATIAINDRSQALQRQGKRIYRLGLGQSPFPVPDLLVRALQDNAHQKDYLPTRGLLALREAIVDFYRRTQHLEFQADNVLIGPGSKELMFIAQLTFVGDLVIPTPSWVSYAPQARIVGRRVHWLPTDPTTGLGVTPEALEALCREEPDRARLLILNYPGNPTGTTYSVEQLQAIAGVARRYRVLLLADEIYGGLTFSGEHVSIARFYPEGTIISNGLSKWLGAGGWRLGAFVFPDSLQWLLRAMTSVASETFTSTSAPIQYAAVRGFERHDELEDYLAQSRGVLAALCLDAWRRLTDAGATVLAPKGGFYLFPNFEPLRERLQRRDITNGPEFCERLLEETGVACLPGNCFGRPDDELSARIACVDFDGREALRAAAAGGDIDEAFLRCYCANVVEAIDRLCEWLQR